MQVKHSFKGVECRGECENPQFLMTNGIGGFTLLAVKKNLSRFNGQFIERDCNLYKTVEDIRLIATEPTCLANDFIAWTRESNSAKEMFLQHKDALLLDIDGFNGYAELTLDCRHIYDYDDKGRYYRIYTAGDRIMVEYAKYRGPDVHYRIYIAIKGASGYLKNEHWEQRVYDTDRKRGSFPWECYVYNALRFRIDGKAFVCIASGSTAEEASGLAEEAYYSKQSITAAAESQSKNDSLAAAPPDIALADLCCRRSIAGLLCGEVSSRGLYAGLPWFHQFWTRDEEISLGGLILSGKKNDAIKILGRHLSQILPDGRIPNRWPPSQLGSADGIGWAGLRASQLVQAGLLTKDNILAVNDALKLSLARLLEHHGSNGLISNNALETWMDTSYRQDDRAGFRIEIQALTLAMMNLLQSLANSKVSPSYDKLESALREHVRQEFWHKPALSDGVNDPLVRPNIFIAYYAYPALLESREWRSCFSHVLSRLWLSWGGLSSIDTKNELFFPAYTGENNRSYHRGDSWYFLNNMAAICMLRCDSRRFRKEIDLIAQASAREILFMGVAGQHAELSSASIQMSEGCTCQAWSAALFIELVHELYRKNG